MEQYARTVVVFGKWALWATIVFGAISLAISLAINGNVVIGAALVALVVVGAIYNLRGNTNI